MCAIAAVVGAVTWLAMQWFGHPMQVDAVKASHEIS